MIEIMEHVKDIVFDHAMGLAFFGFLALVAVIVAGLKGFFRYPKEKLPSSTTISLGDMVGCFTIYFSVQLLVVPFFVLVAIYLLTGSWTMPSEATIQLLQGWIFLGGTGVVILSIATYLKFLGEEKRDYLLGSACAKDVWLGLAGWCVGYPIVMAIAHFSSIVVAMLWAPADQEQVAVRFLKGVDSQALLALSIFITVLIIPIIEEVLFRGFLQAWLRQRWGRNLAILATAAIFALFHYSASQGLANLPFCISLFVLACFLGFIYERQHSLLSPIVLHILFNAVGVSMMFTISK